MQSRLPTIPSLTETLPDPSGSTLELLRSRTIGFILFACIQSWGTEMAKDSEKLSTRTIRRHELRSIVPLADTTIYDMEQRGEFPRRFNLTSRCVVWDLAEVEDWLKARRQVSDA